LVINAIGLWGCVHEGGIEPIFEQPDEVLTTDSSVVPQTLEASPHNPSTESSTPEQIATLPTTETPKKEELNSRQTVASPAPLTKPHPIKNTSAKLEGNLFGEYSGVKTRWEEMKHQLEDQLQEQEQKTKALQVKLQLIEQIAEHVNFTTKAYVTQQSVLLAEFTIENRAPYAIKDISITCDQIAPTGTIIQSHAETIYDIIKPTTRSTYTPIPFGTKHRQTQSLQCQITNFTVHNS
jgi:hypothetical protein